MYGKGLYSTRDWLGQFGGKGSGYMNDYGNAIIIWRNRIPVHPGLIPE
jgi:hypothetical protein